LVLHACASSIAQEPKVVTALSRFAVRNDRILVSRQSSLRRVEWDAISEEGYAEDKHMLTNNGCAARSARRSEEGHDIQTESTSSLTCRHSSMQGHGGPLP
jgi:hypothetical protein